MEELRCWLVTSLRGGRQRSIRLSRCGASEPGNMRSVGRAGAFRRALEERLKRAACHSGKARLFLGDHQAGNDGQHLQADGQVKLSVRHHPHSMPRSAPLRPSVPHKRLTKVRQTAKNRVTGKSLSADRRRPRALGNIISKLNRPEWDRRHPIALPASFHGDTDDTAHRNFDGIISCH